MLCCRIASRSLRFVGRDEASTAVRYSANMSKNGVGRETRELVPWGFVGPSMGVLGGQTRGSLQAQLCRRPRGAVMARRWCHMSTEQPVEGGKSATPSFSESSSSSSSDSMFAEDKSFADLGLTSELVKRLSECGFKVPTKSQALAIPKVIEGSEDLVVAAETGSGKTFAYILPIIQHILQNRKGSSKGDSIAALVLVPTAELTAQLERFVNNFNLGIKISSLAGDKYSVPRGTDIVTASPRCFLDRGYPEEFQDIKWLVIDEADMLLEGSFVREVEKVLYLFRRPLSRRRVRQLMNAGEPVPETSHPQEGQPQLVFVGATFPERTGEKAKSVLKWIKKIYPDTVQVRTNLIHRVNPLLEETWIEVPQSEKPSKLVEVLQSGPEGQILVFCNSVQNVLEVFTYLKAVPDIANDVLVTHRDLHWTERLAALDGFREGERRIMVCTDVAARGIDLGDKITHVVQYDFAKNVVNHLHRVGRTARAGNAGTGTYFVPDEKNELAQAIRTKEKDTLENAFSRNRAFRHRLRKKWREENPDKYQKGGARSSWEHKIERSEKSSDDDQSSSTTNADYFDGWEEVDEPPKPWKGKDFF